MHCTARVDPDCLLRLLEDGQNLNTLLEQSLQIIPIKVKLLFNRTFRCLNFCLQ